MDWLRQIPIGQYVDGTGSWLRLLDARLKLGWTVVFLLTPILAGPWWRLSLVGLLLVFTALSGLPWRLWRRTLPLLLALSVLVGALATTLPTGSLAPASLNRPPQELALGADQQGMRWELLRLGPVQLGPLPLGPFVVTRRSAELGINSATLLFTVIHSANLLLLTTPPEELVWGLSWCMAPLARLGVPVERLGFTLLLSLRFLPLVQEEFQNLLRSLATRSVNLRRLGFQASVALVLALGERLLANVLLRAEQGAEALLARGGQWIAPSQLLRSRLRAPLLQALGWLGLLAVLVLRWRFGAL
ncbi:MULTISPECIES: energy-coupling factor transporter transmembrane component T family protein [unclassified Synechococcus]|uniref:energy-coupling factor transporter transmembrane component T family protein n=1 Tax=unclassified Synechococcus TaxID=2626047 RepID=UPI0020010E34|nr:energy-coupling factor transporter transmembrane component T [Synechococcus sp. A10-1-5-1]UPM49725.1 energy-coupling factor transporter transmembrane protein EcfT [Synechococcus sp. A10-1-5-1]